jgi:hypothetical protein
MLRMQRDVEQRGSGGLIFYGLGRLGGRFGSAPRPKYSFA